jgi:hypothetical protein
VPSFELIHGDAKGVAQGNSRRQDGLLVPGLVAGQLPKAAASFSCQLGLGKAMGSTAGSFDVGEQQGDRSGRQRRHDSPMTPRSGSWSMFRLAAKFSQVSV